MVLSQNLRKYQETGKKFKKSFLSFAMTIFSGSTFSCSISISIWIEFKENSTTNLLCIYCPYNSTTIRVTCVRNIYYPGFCGCMFWEIVV